MLIIVMHNQLDYLEAVVSAMKNEGITDATIIEKEGIGASLIGETGTLFFTRGRLSQEYDKALIGIVKDEQKMRRILDAIERDTHIGALNLGDTGFICTVPFRWIKNLELESTKIKKGGRKVNISKYLKEEQICLNIEASGKETVIRELGNFLRGAKEITDFDSFLKDVFEREKMGTTGIGNGTAIPHARTDATSEFVIAFGRSVKGVEFQSLDSQQVKLIFLMATPKHDINGYLQILARLTRLLRKADFRKSLMEVSNAREVIEVFAKTEE